MNRKIIYSINLKLALSALLTLIALAVCIIPLQAQSNAPMRLVWSSNPDFHLSGAWGDFDNDGDLDLAVGRSSGITIYRNDGTEVNSTQLIFTPAFILDSQEAFEELAWGDYNNDGWLDLATATVQTVFGIVTGQPNHIYRNFGKTQLDGQWDFRLAWSSADSQITSSVAWADYDRDGDLDLAFGNDGAANQLYRNNGSHNGTPDFTLVWSAQEVDNTSEIAWGDLNHDGYPDLATGNGKLGEDGAQPERLYLNQAGQLPLQATWTSSTSDTTISIAWGDADGDGDLDLAVGNGNLDLLTGTPIGEPNRIYRNDAGILSSNPVWTSTEVESTLALAWADADSDGDADLLVGNNGISHLYRNDSTEANGPLQLLAIWNSPAEYTTFDIVPADANQDGMIDIALINGNEIARQVVQVYRNEAIALGEPRTWGLNDKDDLPSLAWGDVDGDGYLDLATSYAQTSSTGFGIYHNQDGLIPDSPTRTISAGFARTLIWGDVDNDFDLDLAVSSVSQNLAIYRNDQGVLNPNPIWQSGIGGTPITAWGDYDGDGDLDLATVTDVLRIYRNDQGTLSSSAVWTSVDSGPSLSVAWGDVDNDGDLDLAIGNVEPPNTLDNPNRVYRNDGVNPLDQKPIFTLYWSSQEFDPLRSDNSTIAVAWGDVDGDGDLDLAVGDQLLPVRLYRNDHGQLTPKAIWHSSDSNSATAIDWGDFDSDGDLDLIIADGAITRNGGTPVGRQNRLYRNEGGQLSNQAVWFSPDLSSTWGIGWGDVDNDGDLDLAAANYKGKNLLYTNNLYPSMAGTNSPPRIVIQRPGATANAYGNSSAEVLTTSTITIHYTLFDAEGDSVARIFPEFSANGGGQWFPATQTAGGDGTTNLKASPLGVKHTFLWRVTADITKSDNVLFRLYAQPGYTHTPIYWAATAAQSPPFRVAPPWYIRVVDELGNAVEGATVYVNGQPITQTATGLIQTDRAGILVPLAPLVGQKLVAVWQVAEEPSHRLMHDHWAYRTFLTSLAWDTQGIAHELKTNAVGEQRLVLQRKNPLILFNLVVSVEWDTDDHYLQQLATALRSASTYLLDLTDGQMALGQVKIYEKSEQWENADIQLSAKHGVHPHAYIGGIVDTDISHVMAVGRGWNRNASDSATWDGSDGFRTLIHEFGHYALQLYDEYVVLDYDENGNLQGSGERSAFCVSELVKQSNSLTESASAMYWQYTSSEFSARNAPGLWSNKCESTLQTQHNPIFRPKPQTSEGESTWDTIARVFSDKATPQRWQIVTPTQRNTVWLGPEQLSTALPAWPQIELFSTADSSPSFSLTIFAPDGFPYKKGALVTLYQSPLSGNKIIGQGLTDENGKLNIVGAKIADTLRVVTLDGRYYGEVVILSSNPTVSISLSPSVQVQGAATSSTPYIHILPELTGTANEIQLYFQLYHFDAQSKPLLGIILPGSSASNAPVVAYNPATGIYSASLSFIATQGGSGQVTGYGLSSSGQAAYLNSDYRLHLADSKHIQEFFTTDGNLQLYLPANSLQGDRTIFVINVLPGSSNPPPTGLALAGEPYDISVSGSVSKLDKPGVLTLHYDPTVTGNFLPLAPFSIYFWDPTQLQWRKQDSVIDADRHTASTKFEKPGIYALFRQAVVDPVSQSTYLPLISR